MRYGLLLTIITSIALAACARGDASPRVQAASAKEATMVNNKP